MDLAHLSILAIIFAVIASAGELSPTFFEGRKYTLFLISGGYHIVSLTVMGIIIAFFVK
jgi:hypothetical protein